MPDSKPVSLDPETQVRLDQVSELIQRAPEEALQMAQELERTLTERGDVAFLHITYAMIFGQLAINAQSQTAGELPHPDAVAHAQRAVEEFRKASELSEFGEAETYQETVVTRPAGLFRKAQTETRTLTRNVSRRKIRLDMFPKSLDPVAALLEKATPGFMWKSLGRVRFGHLFFAGHATILSGVDIDDFSKADLHSINEVWLESGRPIRGAVWVMGRKYPDSLVAISLSEQPNVQSGAANITESCVLAKKGEIWVRV